VIFHGIFLAAFLLCVFLGVGIILVDMFHH
jgi:hypothetical protein